MRLGHRVSLGLGLFSETDRLDEARRASVLADLASSGPLEIGESRAGICQLDLDGTAVSLMRCPYAWLEPASSWKGLPVASLEDIAAMKLSALVGRGAKKDFVDVYWLSRELGLKAVLACAEKKFPGHSDFTLQAARALVYFDDAEKEPLPRILKKVSWEEVKAYFEKEVPPALRLKA